MLKKRYGTLNNKCFSSKKAQVTIFIILGILLLLALAVIVAVKTELVTFKPEEAATTEKGRVESYLTSCIDKLGDEALEFISIQGGYVKVPEEIVEDPNLHLKVSPMHVLPYWAYGSNTDFPELPQVKAQIDSHIQENLRACVFDLEPFQETYDIIEKSGITADTEIVDSKVIFKVRWNLEVRDKAGEVISELINHVAESPIKLKRLHETAKQIVEREMKELKLEDLTQDLIALEHPNVPVSGLELSCGKKEWTVDAARTTLQDMLRVNLKELQVKGTEIIEYPEGFDYYENHYLWSLGENFRMKDVNVVFDYQNNYPFSFQVTPSSGNKMSSGKLGGQDLIQFLCLQVWKFTYDVSYPVVVRVTDETTGYVLNIAFTVHLVRNMPNRKSEIIPRESFSKDYITDREFCLQSHIPMTVLTWELVDNNEGVYYHEPLGGVNISFTCLKHGCDYGQTEFDFAETGYQAGKIFDLPYCVGGILRGKKEGYKESWTRIVTKNGATAELELAPILKLPLGKITVVKHDIDGTEIGPAQELADEEAASIKITYQKNDTLFLLTGEPFHQSTVVVSPQLGETAKFQNAEFLAEADFTYEMEIFAFNDNQFIGGYKGRWTPAYDQLEQAEEVVFHVIAKEDGSDEDKFTLMADLEKNSRLVPLPEIK